MPGNKGGKEPVEASSRRSTEAERREAEHDKKVRLSIEEHRRTLTASEQVAIEATAKRLAEQSASVDMQIQTKQTLDALHRGVEPQPTQPADRNVEVRTLATGAAESVQAVRKRRPVFNWMAKHVFQLLTASTSLATIGVSIPSMVVNAMTLAAGKTPPGMSDEDKALLQEALERWQNKEDKEFWTEVGKLVDEFQIPLQTQQLMGALILPLCKPATFAWEREKDKRDAVYTLFDAYRPKLESKAMYDALAKFAYVRDPARPTETEALPRKEATSVLILALQRVIVFRRTTAVAA